MYYFLLLDDNKSLSKEVESLQRERKKATEDHEEARTKLEVLTEYFKGKEVEMQRYVNGLLLSHRNLKTNLGLWE